MKTFLRCKDTTGFHLKSLTWVVHSLIVFIHRFIIPDGDFETVKCPCWILMRYRTHTPAQELTGTCAATCCRRGGSGRELVGVRCSVLSCAGYRLVSGLSFHCGQGCSSSPQGSTSRAHSLLTSWESRFSVQSIQPPWIWIKGIFVF